MDTQPQSHCPACRGAGRIHYTNGSYGECHGVSTWEVSYGEICTLCDGLGTIRATGKVAGAPDCGACHGHGYFEDRPYGSLEFTLCEWCGGSGQEPAMEVRHGS